MGGPAVAKEKREDGDGWAMDTAVLLAQPFLDRTLVYFFSALFVGLFAYAYCTDYTRTETARGEIGAAAGFSTVVAEDGALISELYAKPGEAVLKGDPLARLTRPRIASEGDDPLQISIVQMHEALRNFDQRISANERAATATRSQIGQVIRSATISRAAVAERNSLTAQRRNVADRRLDMLEELANQGMVTGMAVDQARAQSLQLMQEASDAQFQMNELSRGRDERVAILEMQVRDLAQNTLALRTERLATQKQLNDLQASQTFDVLAPVDGFVAAIPVRLGQRVEPGQRIFAIAQKSAQLTAVLEVPSRAIGLIEQGQRVSLKYDAFPFQSYGLRFGTIVRVETASIDAGGLNQGAERPEDRLFLVEVLPDEDHVLAYGQKRPLRVGMVLSADIEVERRSLLSWWLSPLFALKGRLG